MTERSWKITVVLIVLGSILTAFFGWNVMAGYLLGSAACIVNYKRNERYWTGILNQGSATKWTGMFHWIINYAIMAAVMFISAMKPQYLNVFSTTAGLLLIKIAVIVETILGDKKKGK